MVQLAKKKSAYRMCWLCPILNRLYTLSSGKIALCMVLVVPKFPPDVLPADLLNPWVWVCIG